MTGAGRAVSPAGHDATVGGDVAPGLLRHLADAYGLRPTDWEQSTGDDTPGPAAPDLLLTLRGSLGELRTALGRGARAYVELGLTVSGGLPTGWERPFAGGDRLHVSLSTSTIFTADPSPVLCDRLVRSGWMPADRANDVEIALHEAISNAVIHGNLNIAGGPAEARGGFDAYLRLVQQRLTDPVHATTRVRIDVDRRDGELLLSVEDEGNGHAGVPAAPVHPAQAKSGRGIGLMHALTDAMSYSDGGRRVHLLYRT